MNDIDIFNQAVTWGIGVLVALVLQTIVVSLGVYFGLKLHDKSKNSKKG